jgi:fibronectin type 3 domain-containing protein
MKRLLTIWMILSGCLSFSLAQGIHGKVTFTGKATVVITGNSILLAWNASQGATSYCVYRGTTHGEYTKIASQIKGTTYTDIQVTHNQTFYYVATAISGGIESGYSNEIVAVIP